jgi:high-affinity Fe2+/Pb2+ permease
MTLKAKSILWLIISLLLTAGFFVLLYFAFNAGFQLLYSLTLLVAALVMMVCWICYYLALGKYKDSLNPAKKQKYHKKGNRKESRKSVNRIK